MVLSALLLLCSAWASEPPASGVAPFKPHPTAAAAVDRMLDNWQAATWSSMSGGGGSPAYRDVANRMNVVWRQVEAGTPAMYLSQDEQQRVVASALSGTAAGLQTAVQDLIAGNPELHLLGKASQLVAGPNLEVRRSSGGPEVHLNRPAESAAATRARLQDGGGASATTLRMGGGLRLARDSQTPEDSEAGRLLPTLGAWAQATAVGVDVVRLDASAQRSADGGAFGPWSVVCRERLNESWTLAVDARGGLGAPDQLRVAAGPDISLPGSWVVGLRLADEAPFSGTADLRVEAVLRSRLYWRLPFAPKASARPQPLPDATLIPTQPG